MAVIIRSPLLSPAPSSPEAIEFAEFVERGFRQFEFAFHMVELVHRLIALAGEPAERVG
jgi:hypothetical protein